MPVISSNKGAAPNHIGAPPRRFRGVHDGALACGGNGMGWQRRSRTTHHSPLTASSESGWFLRRGSRRKVGKLERDLPERRGVRRRGRRGEDGYGGAPPLRRIGFLLYRGTRRRVGGRAAFARHRLEGAASAAGAGLAAARRLRRVGLLRAAAGADRRRGARGPGPLRREGGKRGRDRVAPHRKKRQPDCAPEGHRLFLLRTRDGSHLPKGGARVCTVQGGGRRGVRQLKSRPASTPAPVAAGVHPRPTAGPTHRRLKRFQQDSVPDRNLPASTPL